VFQFFRTYAGPPPSRANGGNLMLEKKASCDPYHVPKRKRPGCHENCTIPIILLSEFWPIIS